MSILQEFKDFALKGNVVDMSIGIIIGDAFWQIISSGVANVIMPFIGFMLGGVNFTTLQLVLREETLDQPALTLTYGTFLQSCVDFVIIAITIFLAVKTMNTLKSRTSHTTTRTHEKIVAPH